LFAPIRSTTTYLINNNGKLIHSWQGTSTPGLSAYLLGNGHLLRTAFTNSAYFNTGGKGGNVEEYDWDGNLVWQYNYASSSVMQHHDAAKLPNGNILTIAWESKSQTEALNEGRNPSYVSASGLWPDHIIEIDSSSSSIIWEWHIWDHLIQDYDSTRENFGVISDHDELIDINFVKQGNPTNTDWTHTNSIDYDSVFDQILLSVHGFNEIWVIDHSTTTQEASGHTGGNSGKGGDILYRWGNPRAYNMGTTADQKLFGQHNAHWIKEGLNGAGNMLIFNNGTNRTGGNYSSIDEIVPPRDGNGFYTHDSLSAFGPNTIFWSYSDAPDFYAQNISGTQRLPNGNTLICDGPGGAFFEITPSNQTIWQYINPVIASGPMTQGDSIPVSAQGTQENTVFRAYRYAPDYSAFDGRDLTPGSTIELYPPPPSSTLTPDIYAWKLNTTGATGFNNLPADVQQVRYSSNYVYINCSDVPSYTIGPWPNNPNTVTNQDFVFKIRRNPTQNTGTQTATGLGHIGVWINGVSIFNPKDAMSYNNQGIWNQNAVIVEAPSFDACLGHPPQSGEYHHHQNPHCMYDAVPADHSAILGFAFDGFPVYGPYAYANTNGTGNITRMKSSYRKRSITQRHTLPDGTVLQPSQYGPNVTGQYVLGYYIEDYEYVNELGHLDDHNGRFCVTPEYPNGIYAYFVTIDSLGNSEYPYVIGPTYFGVLETINVGPGSGHATISEPVTSYTGPVTIIATAEPNGNIVPSGNVSVIPTFDKTFTFTRDTGYHLDSVVVDGVKVDSTLSYTFHNVMTNHTIEVFFSPNMLQLLVDDQWNLLSLPQNVSDMLKSVVYPTAISNAFIYNGSYQIVDTLPYGRGYWLKFDGNQTVSITGTERMLDTVDLEAGWNMIGSISLPVLVSGIISIPGGIVTSNFYGYSGSYSITDTVLPGKGYWVKVNQAGQFILSASSQTPQSARIKIIPTSELPPPPPDTEIHNPQSAIPNHFALEQNYPNPFNPVTVIRYGIPDVGASRQGGSVSVQLIIYNMLGQEVATLVDEVQGAGYKSVEWDASRMPSGIYLVRLRAGTFSDTKKIVLLK